MTVRLMVSFLQCPDKSLRMMSTFCRLLRYLKRSETTLSTNVERTSKSFPFFFINSVSNGTHRLMLGDRFIVRDFTWDDSALEKQKRQLADLEIEEKELWVSIPSFPSSFLSPLKKGNRRSAPSLTCLNRRRDCYA